MTILETAGQQLKQEKNAALVKAAVEALKMKASAEAEVKQIDEALADLNSGSLKVWNEMRYSRQSSRG
jgi:F0F1-type ATP synthase membrane subunit b/b'